MYDYGCWVRLGPAKSGLLRNTVTGTLSAVRMPGVPRAPNPERWVTYLLANRNTNTVIPVQERWGVFDTSHFDLSTKVRTRKITIVIIESITNRYQSSKRGSHKMPLPLFDSHACQLARSLLRHWKSQKTLS
jgi:hypothetical protein